MSSVSRPRGRLFQIRGPTAPKLLYPKLLLHHAYVIRGRPEGSSVAFGDEMDVGRHLTAQCLAHQTINEFSEFSDYWDSNRYAVTETDIINSDRRTVSTVAANCNEWSQLSRRQHYILCQTMQTDRVTDRPDRNRTVETELLEPVSIRLNRIRPLYAEAI